MWFICDTIGLNNLEEGKETRVKQHCNVWPVHKLYSSCGSLDFIIADLSCNHGFYGLGLKHLCQMFSLWLFFSFLVLQTTVHLGHMNECQLLLLHQWFVTHLLCFRLNILPIIDDVSMLSCKHKVLGKKLFNRTVIFHKNQLRSRHVNKWQSVSLAVQWNI